MHALLPQGQTRLSIEGCGPLKMRAWVTAGGRRHECLAPDMVHRPPTVLPLLP